MNAAFLDARKAFGLRYFILPFTMTTRFFFANKQSVASAEINQLFFAHFEFSQLLTLAFGVTVQFADSEFDVAQSFPPMFDCLLQTRNDAVGKGCIATSCFCFHNQLNSFIERFFPVFYSGKLQRIKIAA
jgi:hypothetical protein